MGKSRTLPIMGGVPLKGGRFEECEKEEDLNREPESGIEKSEGECEKGEGGENG